MAATQGKPVSANRSNAYQIFILVMTVYALVIMVALLLPLSAPTIDLLRTYDNVICVIFLADFFTALYRAPSRRRYFLEERGWLDLLGSIPSFGVFKLSGLLRLARLSRLARISRILRGQNKSELIADILRNRGQYAVSVTLMLAMLVISLASLFVLQFESQSPDANITTGGDALWWAIVTITTVGYGDKYPITAVGRSAGVFVMVTGIGIIGSLASIMASFLVAPTPESDEPDSVDGGPAGVEARLASLETELRGARSEVAALRQLLERESPAVGQKTNS